MDRLKGWLTIAATVIGLAVTLGSFFTAFAQMGARIENQKTIQDLQYQILQGQLEDIKDDVEYIRSRIDTHMEQ